MRTAYDATGQSSGSIPTEAQIVCGYVPPSPYSWSPQDWSRFPDSAVVRITTSASVTGLGVHTLDVERGAATVAEAVPWARRQRALRQEPTVYCSTGTWGALIVAFAREGEEQPNYHVAAWPGTGANLPTLSGVTAVAHQYLSTPQYDVSVAADHWPGVDPEDGMTSANDVWMAPCNAVWPPGSPEAALAQLGGAVSDSAGAVHESHPAVEWLTVLAGRMAVLMSQQARPSLNGAAAFLAANAPATPGLNAGRVVPPLSASLKYRKGWAALLGGGVPAGVLALLPGFGVALPGGLAGAVAAAAAAAAVVLAPANASPL